MAKPKKKRLARTLDGRGGRPLLGLESHGPATRLETIGVDGMRNAEKIAAWLKRSGQKYVAIARDGSTLFGFCCPGCGALAWADPGVRHIAFHDGNGCAVFHDLGPSSFIVKAERLGLMPRVLPG